MKFDAAVRWICQRLEGPAHDHPASVGDSLLLHRSSRALRVLGLALLVAGLSNLSATEPERNLGVVDLNGRPVDLLAPSRVKGTVLIFAQPDCPISNRYAPTVGELHAKFAREGIAFWLVYPDADVSSPQIRKHLAEFKYPFSAVRDPAHHLVQVSRAQVTPEAAVFTADGDLVYHGRIDDRYESLGRWRPEPTRHDLERAIAAVLQGAPVPQGGPAVGCTISPK